VIDGLARTGTDLTFFVSESAVDVDRPFFDSLSTGMTRTIVFDQYYIYLAASSCTGPFDIAYSFYRSEISIDGTPLHVVQSLMNRE
jgi:hypothetical protein